MRTKLFLLTACLLLAAPLARAQVVLNTNASGPDSLRAVVAAAAPGATITFAAGLSGQTISLGSSEILLDRNVTIDASALPLGITITQPEADILPGVVPLARIFSVPRGSVFTVFLKGLHLTGGSGGGGDQPIFGGAILNYGILSLQNCTLDHNAAFAGGAIFNEIGGTLTLSNCTLTGNYATVFPFVDTSYGEGGAIFNRGSLAIHQSTITNNTAQNAEHRPISGFPNPGIGGGINSTVSFSLFNSIVAGNTAGAFADIYGPYTTGSGNNLVSGDPRLLPLGKYGGPTPTMPPRADSPALNAGSNFLNTIEVTFFFPNDQRGRPRLVGAHVDIGAVELQSPTVVTNLADAGPGSLRQAVSNVEPAGAIITFAAGLSGQSIQLNSTLLLNQNLTIDASALPAGIKLLGSGRVLEVSAGQTVVLRSLEVRNGFHNDAGAGLYNAGTLTLDRCTFANNGIVGEGSYRPPEGGAIYNANTLTLNQCTLAGNVANAGAAIHNHTGASLTVNQSTLAGNEGNFGTGGIRNRGTLTLNNTLLAGNSTSSFFDPNLSDSGTLTLLGNNLTTGDPQLAALGNYGGPTHTMPPQPGSPAKDQGGLGGPAFAMDQRGFPRVIGTAVDIGAVEEIPGGTYSGANLAGIWQSDTDGDGVPFGTEYALGTDPAVSDANAPGRLRIQISPDNQLSFCRNPAAVPNTQWVLKRSLDLQPGSFTEVFRFNGPTGVSTTASGVVATMGTSGFTITDPTPSRRAFYRLDTEFTP